MRTIALAATGHVPLHAHNGQIINSPLASIQDTSLPLPIVSFQYNNFYWNDARTCLLPTFNGHDLFCEPDCVASSPYDFRSIKSSDVQGMRPMPPLQRGFISDLCQLRIIDVHSWMWLLTISCDQWLLRKSFVITCNKNTIFVAKKTDEHKLTN